MRHNYKTLFSDFRLITLCLLLANLFYSTVSSIDRQVIVLLDCLIPLFSLCFEVGITSRDICDDLLRCLTLLLFPPDLFHTNLEPFLYF